MKRRESTAAWPSDLSRRCTCDVKHSLRQVSCWSTCPAFGPNKKLWEYPVHDWCARLAICSKSEKYRGVELHPQITAGFSLTYICIYIYRFSYFYVWAGDCKFAQHAHPFNAGWESLSSSVGLFACQSEWGTWRLSAQVRPRKANRSWSLLRKGRKRNSLC